MPKWLLADMHEVFASKFNLFVEMAIEQQNIIQYICVCSRQGHHEQAEEGGGGGINLPTTAMGVPTRIRGSHPLL